MVPDFKVNLLTLLVIGSIRWLCDCTRTSQLLENVPGTPMPTSPYEWGLAVRILRFDLRAVLQ
jgi:hypothetical protein